MIRDGISLDLRTTNYYNRITRQLGNRLQELKGMLHCR